MKRLIVILLSFCLLSVVFAEKKHPANLQLERFIQYMKDVKGIDDKGKKPGKAEAQANKKIATKAIDIVDIKTISERALGPAVWKKIGPAKQKNFVTTLERLVVLNAFPRSSKFMNSVKYVIQPAKVVKKQATVRQTVTIKGDDENPEDTEMLIDYTFEKISGAWRIVNLAFDNTSIVSTYSNQFANIIRNKGFSKLVSLMSRKKKELEEEYGAVIPK